MIFSFSLLFEFFVVSHDWIAICLKIVWIQVTLSVPVEDSNALSETSMNEKK